MNFINEWGFDVKQGQTAAFTEWLAKNEEKFAATFPEGTTYEGTYAAIFTTEKDNGRFRFLVGMDRYADQDVISQAMKDGGEFADLMEAYTEFMDQDNHANWSQNFLRRVSDTAFWGE